MDQQNKPEIPDGMRELRLGEKIKPGDLKWNAVVEQWTEVTAVEQLDVRHERQGFYCRKIG